MKFDIFKNSVIGYKNLIRGSKSQDYIDYKVDLGIDGDQDGDTQRRVPACPSVQSHRTYQGPHQDAGKHREEAEARRA